MAGNEWSLLFFTLFAQAAGGLIIGLAVVSAGREPTVRRVYTNVRPLVTCIALVLMTAALGLSFLHPGSPARAVYSLSNMHTSWLSREILMVSIFTGILLLWCILPGSSVAAVKLNRLMLWISSLAGVVMVYTMARLYMVPTIPAWDSALTMVLFFSSGMLLGISLLFLIMIPSSTGEFAPQPGHVYKPALAIIMALVFLARILFVSGTAISTGDAVFPPQKIPLLLNVLHYLFVTGGIALVIYRILVSPVKSAPPRRLTFVLSFSLILIGEVIGRYIFYAGYFRLGV